MKSTNLPDLSAKDLLAVLSIVDHGSYVGASLHLSMSQSALTRRIMRIESLLGVALFTRTTRRVELTPEGREFSSVAERMVNDLRITISSLRETSEEPRGQIVISTVMSVAQSILSEIVQEYRQLRPRVEVHIKEGVHGNIIEDVRSGVSDMGITFLDDLPDMFECYPLAVEDFHIVLPESSTIEYSSEVPINILKNVDLVSFPRESNTRKIIDSSAAAAGFSLSHAITATQFATVLHFVKAGVGPAVIPSGAVRDAHKLGLKTMRIDEPNMSRKLGVITSQDRELWTIGRDFLNIVKKRLKKI